jgi:uncharacterized phiE125 gp8 family phage protein
MLFPLRLDTDPLVIEPPWAITSSMITEHCRIDSSDDEDVQKVYLKAAIAWAENETHRTIFARSSRWVLRDFPRWRDQGILLPRGKTQSVQSVAYSSGGETFTLTGPSSGSPAGADYQEDLRGEDGAVLMPPRGGCWPSTDCDVPAPVTITFTAGWLASEVPADIIHAILFAISDFVEIKGTLDLDPAMIAAGGPRYFARESLISSYRLSRWY